MAKLIIFLSGVFAGLTIVIVPVLTSDDVASRISQSIYDCGIRVAAGAEGGTISGFTIKGHKFGVCLDGSNMETSEKVKS